MTETLYHTGLRAMLCGIKSAADSQAVLDEFVGGLHRYCSTEPDLARRTRSLHLVRSELVAQERDLDVMK